MGGVDAVYADLVRRVLRDGDRVETRNSRCRRLFAEKAVFRSTPLVSARKTAWKTAIREWEWFMTGSNNVNDAHPSVRPWWGPWADPAGAVLFNYGEQFRRFTAVDQYTGSVGLFDQIAALVEGVRSHPFSRRNVVTTWNPPEMADGECRITNCHGTVIQAFVDAVGHLHLVTYQRSADVVCGLPHNWIQYWAFLLWLAARTGKAADSLTWLGGDVHVYETHKALASRIVGAAPSCGLTPPLAYRPSLPDFRADDFALEGEYSPVLADRAEMVV